MAVLSGQLTSCSRTFPAAVAAAQDGEAVSLAALMPLSVPVRGPATLHPSRYGRMTDRAARNDDH
jgi:hypothetical protein